MSIINFKTSRTGEREFSLERINVFLGANGTGKTKLIEELRDQAPETFENYTPLYIEGGRAVQMHDSLALNNQNFNNFRTLDQILSGFKNKRKNTLSSRVFDGLKALEELAVEAKSKHSDDVVKWIGNGKVGEPPANPENQLQRVFDIFSDIFPSIELKYLPSNKRLVCLKNGSEYGPTGLSDGEKQVFSILVDIVELTDEKSVLFVDEPELNLNPGLANRLWSSIEGLLPRSIFLYATHSVNFALRDAVQRRIILSNLNNNLQEISDLDELSYEDQQDLLGNLPALVAEANTLVVEGHDESFDSIFYRWLLSDMSFSPHAVGGSEDVIAIACREGKWNKISPNVRITGVVDRDYKSESQITKLKSKDLIILDLHEAESYLCDPQLICDLTKEVGAKDEISKQEVENKIFSYIEDNDIKICAKRACEILKLNIRPSVRSKTLAKIKNPEDLQTTFVSDVKEQMERANQTFDEGNVKSVLEKELKDMKDVLRQRNTQSALVYLPGKELLESFVEIVGVADTNGLVRAARTHLNLENYPHIISIKNELQAAISKGEQKG